MDQRPFKQGKGFAQAADGPNDIVSCLFQRCGDLVSNNPLILDNQYPSSRENGH